MPLFILGLLSCSNDEKAIEIVTEEVERGAVIRTIAINNADFDIANLQSTFSVDIEEMDIEDGGLLEELEILVQFKDNTPANGNSSTSSSLFQTIPASEWITGPTLEGLPRTSLNYTYEELSVSYTHLTLPTILLV